MIPRSPLDDPRLASFAWARYKRLMRWMVMVTLAVIAGPALPQQWIGLDPLLHRDRAWHRRCNAADVGADGTSVSVQWHRARRFDHRPAGRRPRNLNFRRPQAKFIDR